MKTILVVNPKGGCGKSTVATNLSSYYALWEVPVALVDYDPQQSSLEWLAARTARNAASAGSALNPIQGIDASGGRDDRAGIEGGVKRVVIDAPARIPLAQMQRLFDFADKVVLPVLPSPMDIRAAARFVGELMLNDMLRDGRVGLVANRVREHTLIYGKLETFLRQMDIPLVTHLRDNQNYIRAAQTGYGIFEMAPYQADKDIEQWRPLIHWIEKK